MKMPDQIKKFVLIALNHIIVPKSEFQLPYSWSAAVVEVVYRTMCARNLTTRFSR
jgi:hypothetical protein